MTAPQTINIIGGTSGSGGSGWVIAIITALVTAFATFWVGYLLEEHKRRRDVRALAGTFIAEISATLRLFSDLRLEDRYLELRAIMQKMDASATWSGTSSDAFMFPVTVYEKCADRIGTLGSEIAADVVRFYNFLNGFRMAVRIAVGSGPLPIPGRIEAINSLLATIKNERPLAENLLGKLRIIADRRLFP